MRGLLFPGDRSVELAEVPDPVPGAGEVLVQIHCSAICGTDLHRYRQSAAERAALLRVVSGHEPVGVVAALGPGVHGPSLWDRIVVYPLVGCNRPGCAACRSQQIKLCPNRRVMTSDVHGANAEYMAIPAINCLPLPDDFSFEDGAVLACNFGTAYSATRRANLSGQSVVAVFGLGPVGLCTVLSARAMGAQVIGVDVVSERLEFAKALGAGAVVDAGSDDVVVLIRELTGGCGVDAAIDTSGVSAAQTSALEVLRHEGKLVLVGIGLGREWSIRPREQVIVRDVSITGSLAYEASAWESMLTFVRRHRLPLTSVVTATYAPDRAVEAFRVADEGRSGKILFRWR